jgi:OOP family OmpA-OmpF porin
MHAGEQSASIFSTHFVVRENSAPFDPRLRGPSVATMRDMHTHTLCALLAIPLFACAAADAQTQLTSPANEPVQTSITSLEMQKAPGFPDLGRGEARFIRIDLGPDTFAECQRISPKFPFNSASTYAIDRAQLAAFATCLNSVTMRDHKVRLVGRADPRGTSQYNDKLGMQRANAIKQLLVEQGIDANRLQIESDGKAGAVGIPDDAPDTSTNPQYTYGYDRRVDVVVTGSDHAP